MAETYTRATLQLATGAITTTGALVYTATTSCIVTTAQASNIDGSTAANVDFALDVGGAGSTIRYYAKDVDVAAGAALNLAAGSHFLESGDKLRARADTSGDADIIVSILEIT